MHIDRIVGRSLMDALERARAAHGEQAVVLSQEVLSGGDVALAVVRKDAARAIPVSGRVTTSRDPLREVVEKLVRHGASESFVASIRASVNARAGEGHVLDLAAEAIAALYPAVALPRVAGATQVVAFVGSTGSGKTSLVARLAARLSTARRNVALVSLDGDRPGAVEPLVAVARAHGLPLLAPRGAAAWDIADLYGADLVLVDTTGDAERDTAHLAPFLAHASAKLRLSTHLVLSAVAALDAHTRSFQRWHVLAPTACAITKLDETSKPGVTLEAALTAGLPVSFYSTSAQLDAGFHRAAPDHAADLYLQGALA